MFSQIDFTKLFEILRYVPSDPLLFGSGLFLFLFFFLILLYRVLAKYSNARIYLLIIFSFFFYYKASGFYLILLAGSAVLNFYLGKFISLSSTQFRKKLLFLTALILNLGLLGYFKYTNFFIQVLADLKIGQFDPLDIFLPIGISFFTFKALSYILDVYLGMMEPTDSLKDFCLYISFFPNILAGPIDRAVDFLPQIKNNILLTKEDFSRAIFLIVSGLIKKNIISDYIGLNFVDRIFDSPLRFTGVENLLGVYGYALQIYCDFSGYSDMAIGIGLLLGYKLMDNFNSPYKATSISDFWKRWHISLSSWLLDYVFAPLQMKFRRLRIYGNSLALLITFTLVGLWHGASWSFIVWGFAHGFLMMFSLMTKNIRKSFTDKLHLTNTKILKVIQVIITFHLVAVLWIFFRASNFQTGIDIITQIITFFKPNVFLQFIVGYLVVFILMFAGFVLHFIPATIELKYQKLLKKSPVILQALFLAVVIWIVIQFRSAEVQPFIYFQF